jgi:putative endonuclease
MYYLYILKSLKDLGYYIGTSDDVQGRLINHNKGKTKSIKHRVPFILKYTEQYQTKTEARKREIFLKRNYQASKALLNSIGFNLK